MSEQPQTFATHKRFDPVYHFGAAALVLGVLVLSWIAYLPVKGLRAWMVIAALLLAILWAKVRTYALRVQDRIIRLEETLRLRELLPVSLAARIPELTPGQFVALRFASDAELPALFVQALDERLAPAEIKKRIHAWRPDTFRV